MNISKKIISVGAGLFSSIAPLSVLAQINVPGAGGMSGPSITISSLGVAIGNVVWIVFTVIAVIMFVVAGVLFLTSMGEAEKIRTARLSFFWGIAGIIVAILAYSAITLIKTSIGA